MSECPDVKFLKTLVFADWPQEEIFPPSFEMLAVKIHRTFWLMMSALLGTCDDKMSV